MNDGSEMQVWTAPAALPETPGFSATALAMKNDALESAALIRVVKTPEQNALAVVAQTKVNDLVRLATQAFEDQKAPLNKIKAALKSEFDRFMDPLLEEQVRLARAVGDYKALEDAKARAAEAARKMELQRIENERLAKIEEARREADAKRLSEWRAAEEIRTKRESEELELQRALAAAGEHERMEQLRAESEARARKEAEEAKVEAAKTAKDSEDRLLRIEAESKARMAEVVEDIPKPSAKIKGQVVMTSIEVNVYDVAALYAQHPHLVKLVPDIMGIKALIKAGQSLNGVTSTTKTTATTRSAKAQAIDVQQIQ